MCFCCFINMQIKKICIRVSNNFKHGFQTRPCFRLVFHWVSKLIHLTRIRCSGWVWAASIINEFEKVSSGNTFLIYSDFYGWSNWLIMALHFAIHPSNMLPIVKLSHGISFRRPVAFTFDSYIFWLWSQISVQLYFGDFVMHGLRLLGMWLCPCYSLYKGNSILLL